jgi:hypothetical protein
MGRADVRKSGLRKERIQVSEYVRKQALVQEISGKIDWLIGQSEVRSCGHENKAREFSKVISEFASLRGRIQSGAFDAPDGEVQRLRAAAIKLHETLNTYWQGDCEKADVVAVQSKLCDVLSTTTEPTDPYTIRRDEYGHAVAIERNGYTVLHLQPGTERNEQEVEGIVALLNMNAAKVERVKINYCIECDSNTSNNDFCSVCGSKHIIPGINAPEKEGQTE